MSLTAEERQEYIDLAFALANGHKDQSDKALSRVMRELTAHIALIEETRIPKMQKYLSVLQQYNDHEKSDAITAAIADLSEDANRSRLALIALQDQ